MKDETTIERCGAIHVFSITMYGGRNFITKAIMSAVEKRHQQQHKKRWTQRAMETAGPMFGIFTPPALRLRRGARGQ